MVCPACAVGLAGGWLGGYVGIRPPSQTEGRIFSTAVTTSLVSITIIALKTLFNTSLCIGGKSYLENIIRVASVTFLLGIIYSIGVNYLLNRYFFSPPPRQEESPCCRKQNSSTT